MHKDAKGLIGDFLIWVRASRTRGTYESYTTALSRVFVAWIESQGLVFQDCTATQIASYALYLENRGLKSGTRDLYLTALRSFWWWLDRQGKAPFRPDMIPRVDIIDRVSYLPIETSEYELMFSSLSSGIPTDIRNRAIMSLLYWTGIRVGEMLSIQITDIDFHLMCTKVKTYKRKNHYREIYWGDETNEALKAWLAVRQDILHNARLATTSLFISLSSNHTGNSMDRHHVAHAICTVREKCGINRKISAHSFRHGFATRGMRRSINPRYLQEMMGHAKLNTTMIYM